MKFDNKRLAYILVAFLILIFESFMGSQFARGTTSPLMYSAEIYAQQMVDEALDKQMITYADAAAVQIISKIITPDMTDEEKEKAIHDYIVRNTKYDSENYNNKTIPKESYSPYGVLVLGYGVCQGYAEATQMLCEKAGLTCQVVHGEANSLEQWGGHAWNLVQINGKWYHLDTTWDDPTPDRGNRIEYDYFNLTDEEIGADHRWDKTKYPQAITHYKNTFTMDFIDKLMIKLNPHANPDDQTSAKKFYAAGIVVILILLVLLIRK